MHANVTPSAKDVSDAGAGYRICLQSVHPLGRRPAATAPCGNVHPGEPSNDRTR